MSHTPEGVPLNHRLQPEWELTPVAARAQLDAGQLLIVDVRLEPEWHFARVPGVNVVHIPLHELENRWEDLAEHPAVQSGAAVAALCHHGVRSLKAATLLRELGLPGVKSIAGGIEGWSRAVDRTVPRYQRDGMKVWSA